MRFNTMFGIFPPRAGECSRGRGETGAKATGVQPTWRVLLCALALTLPSAIALADATNAPARISITAMMLDRTALAALPRVGVVASAHHEASSRWQGVALEDLLHHAGAPAGEQLRGQAMRSVVCITASDHYQVVFSLAELDPTLGNEQVILADTQDGHHLGKDGPFRLVVPGDKRPARWIRNVTAIEVTRDSSCKP
jgi:hypothetical protein